MSTLYLYRNSDVLLEQAFKIWVPATVDTLAELCTYISEAIPPVGDLSGKGYRFLYSLQGKPLWRVRECLDAGTVIISPGPGFLARRAPAVADALAAATDVTPTDTQPILRASPSPPAQQPQPRHTAVAAGRLLSSGTHGMVGAGVNVGVPERALSGDSQQDHMSIYVSASPFPGSYERGNAWAGGAPCEPPHPAHTHLQFSGSPSQQQRKEQHQQQQQRRAAPLAAANRTPPEAKQLFGVDGASDEEPQPLSTASVPPPTELRSRVRRASGGIEDGAVPSMGAEAAVHTMGAFAPTDSAVALEPSVTALTYDRPVYGVRGYGLCRDAPVGSGGLVGSNTPHAGGVHGGARRPPLPPLPPPPTYTPASSLVEGAEADDGASLLTGLRTYAARKWRGFSELSAVPPTDVLGEDLVREKVQMHLHSLCWPLRVVVRGPPRSGVSATAALALRTAIDSSGRGGPLYNHLHLVLDGDLLFGDAVNTGRATSGVTRPLDITFAFQIVVRAVLDAVAVQRPALRAKGLLLAQLWDKLITTNASTPPDFTAFAQVTAAVGQKAVVQWDRFARAAFPVLQAARTESAAACGAGRDADGKLRDAAMTIIFYALPGEIASSLDFSGLLYSLDGLGVLATSQRRRVNRPHGDLEAFLRAIWADPNCHVLAAWPAELPMQSIYLAPPSLSAPTLQIRTVGLIPSPASSVFAAAYGGPPLPHTVECRGRPHSVDVFLGCPGYLAALATLARPLVGRSIPTTAFSTYSQARKREKAMEPFNLRIDDAEVGGLLNQLEQLVAAAK